MRHSLKLLKQYFDLQVAGMKNFEFRRMDRNFRAFDEIELIEIDYSDEFGLLKPTGRTCIVRITSILVGFEGMEDGYGVIGTEMVLLPQQMRVA